MCIQNPEDFVQALGQIELLFQDGHLCVDTDGDPYLGFDRVDRRAHEPLDPQMLLDPLEEQFHLPTAFVQLGDGQSRQGKVVGQIDEKPLGFLVEKPDASQTFGISLSAVCDRQVDDLVGTYAGTLLDRQGMYAHIAQRPFCSNHEEGPELVENKESGKVQVPAVHHIEGSGFDRHLVQRMDVVKFSVADMDERGDGAAKVQQRMQFDSALGAPEASPTEQAQTQVDGGGIQCVDCRVQIHGQRFVRIQLSRPHDQLLGQRGVDAPVALFVDVGQGAAPDRAAESEMVEAFWTGAQAVYDIAQALPASQLGVGHAKILVPTREVLDFVIAAETAHATIEMLRMNQSHQLAEDRLPCVHATSLAEAKKHRETGHRTSNRSHLIRRATPVPADGWKISALQQLDRHDPFS